MVSQTGLVEFHRTVVIFQTCGRVEWANEIFDMVIEDDDIDSYQIPNTPSESCVDMPVYFDYECTKSLYLALNYRLYYGCARYAHFKHFVSSLKPNPKKRLVLYLIQIKGLFPKMLKIFLRKHIIIPKKKENYIFPERC